MNAMDAALQANTPVVMVGCFEKLEPLSKNGHRFLLATDGLWIEARRPWCHVVWPLALKSDPVSIPCGVLTRSVLLSFGRFPKWVLERFIQQATTHHPVEVGAVVVWDEAEQSLRYHECETIKSGVGYLKARWPQLGVNESIAIDLHSHGPIGAYFSSQDRADMGSDVVLACVVGKTDRQTPEIKISLFVCGKEIKVEMPEVEVHEFEISDLDEDLLGLI